MRTKANVVPVSLWNMLEVSFKLELLEAEIVPVADKDWGLFDDR
jgi:hypothetical protein